MSMREHREKEQQVMRLLALGVGVRSIAEQFGIPVSLVQTWQNKRDAEIRAEEEPPDERTAKILQLHEQGMSLRAIAREVGVSHQSVANDLMRAGRETHPRIPLYQCEREDAFRSIRDGDAAYFSGYIAARGRLAGDLLTVLAREEQLQALRLLKEWLGASAEPQPPTASRKASWALKIRSASVVRDLRRWGVYPPDRPDKRSRLARVPSIGKTTFRHYAAGFFDGNAQMRYLDPKRERWPQVALTGTERFLRDYAKRVAEGAGVREPGISAGGVNADTCRIVWTSRDDLVRLLGYLYDVEGPRLEQKEQEARQMLEIRPLVKAG